MLITFILVEPKVPENVGASARALKTMGFKKLKLVNPCKYLDGASNWLAHGSFDILEQAEVYSSLSEALRGHDLVIGTTARYRQTKKDYIDITDIISLLEKKTSSAKNIAIVFGREESGLTNDELDFCDITSSIPLQTSFPSLNLAQSVMIYSYELGKMIIPELIADDNKPDQLSVKTLKDKINYIIKGTEIDSNITIKGRIMERVSLAGDKDLNLMQSLANAVISYKKKNKK